MHAKYQKYVLEEVWGKYTGQKEVNFDDSVQSYR